MTLPPEITNADFYIMGQDKAFVVARSPYVQCPTCLTTHALFIVRADSFECLVCSGDYR